MTEMTRMSLKAARVNAGLTQKEVATKLGIGNGTLSDWENYVSFPRADLIPKLCELYGVQYDQIDFLPRNPL